MFATITQHIETKAKWLTYSYDMFNLIFLYENVYIKGRNQQKVLVGIMALNPTGDKQKSEPMMA